MLSLSPVYFFSKSLFQKKSFRNTIRVSNGLDPGLGPNCLQTLSAYDKKIVACKEQLKNHASSL